MYRRVYVFVGLNWEPNLWLQICQYIMQTISHKQNYITKGL